MKIFLKILKWIGLSLTALLVLIILSGLLFRLFVSEPIPPGKLVDIGDFKLHINSTGEKGDKPTLVIETGAGLPGSHFHWLSEGLKDSMRVVRYDRAGIGYSDYYETPRDPKTIARELHTLLEESGESPPYILAGHSFGGLYIRVFTQLYPDDVSALVFLDASHHDPRERLNKPPRRDLTTLYRTLGVLGDMGIIGIIERLNGSVLSDLDFPDEVNKRFLDYSVNGKYFRGLIQEGAKWDLITREQSREKVDFESLPIRVFTAAIVHKGGLRNRGIDPEWFQTERIIMQREIAAMSTDGQQMMIDGHHNSIYTKKENADIICKEILKLTRNVDLELAHL